MPSGTSPSTCLSSNRISPLVGLLRPASTSSIVLFPQPEGPTTEKNWFCGSSRSIGPSAWIAPYERVTPDITTLGPLRFADDSSMRSPVIAEADHAGIGWPAAALIVATRGQLRGRSGGRNDSLIIVFRFASPSHSPCSFMASSQKLRPATSMSPRLQYLTVCNDLMAEAA